MMFVSRFKPYFYIARLDHAFKNIFVIPGIALGYFFNPISFQNVIVDVIVGFLSLTLAASANYTINEWLDRDFDKEHLKKKTRPAAEGLVIASGVYLQYSVLVVASILLALAVNQYFVLVILIFVLAGIVYNVPPLRAKDVPHVDVLTESLNNPLRLLLGWFMVIHEPILPPSSIVLAYWAGGAYLMTSKRIAEIATLGDEECLLAYRPALAKVSETAMQVQSNLFALLSVCFLTVFVVRYRIELLIPMSMIILLFAVYGPLISGKDGLAQTPEYLHRSKVLVIMLVLLVALSTASLFVDLPQLSDFLTPPSFFMRMS